MKQTSFKKLMTVVSMALIMLLTINVATALDVSVNDYDPIPAEAGKSFNLWLKVGNRGIHAQDYYSFEIKPKDGLELSPGEDPIREIGIIGGGSSQTIKYRLFVKDDAYEGTHTFEIIQFSETKLLSEKELSLEVTDKDFKEVDLEVGDIDSDPLRIKPDDDNIKLDVTLQNLGDGTAKGVTAELIGLPEGIDLTQSYSGTSLLGNVNADSTAIATFYIDVDKTVLPGEYFANIKAQYKFKQDEDEDEYIVEETTIPVRLTIKPVPLYEITNFTLDRKELRAGDENVKLTLTIKNIGEEEGESVRLKAYAKTEQPITFDKATDFVAPSLNPGEIGQATLEFDIDEYANLQKYYLDLEIKNVVNDDVITYTEKVPIEITKAKANNPWKPIMFGLVLIGGAVAYWWYKKKTKRTSNRKPTKHSYGKSEIDE